MRAAVVVAVACLSAVGLCAGQDVQASIRKSTHIPAQDLVPALKTLAYERGFQLVFRSEVVGTKHTQGAVGDLTTAEALTKLLEGTNLVYSYLNDKTVTIFPVNFNSPTSLNQAGAAGAAGFVGSYSQQNQLLAAEIAGADAEPVQNGAAGSNADKKSAEKSAALEEIVVTAQKKVENIQDVPVPVTAISAQALIDNNMFRLQDYYTLVPGLNLTTDARGAPVLSIRGLTTSQTLNTTVAETIDDVPYGASSSAAFSWMATDIDPNEVARVEVLRGPQGTLYGASSLGGLLKFVTIEPSVDALSGRIQVGTESIHNGSGPGYNVNGAVNLPLNDTLALRASGFARRDPGYIDNILTGQKGVNSIDADGGRLSALWKPSGDLSVRLDALVQDTRTNGSGFVDLTSGFADLQQSEIRDSGRQDRRVMAFDSIVKAHFGPAEITSVTGYNVNKWNDTYDVSSTYVPIFAVPGAEWFEDNQTRKFSQEIRVATQISERINWLLGLFYTHESTALDLNILSVEPASAAYLGSEYHGDLGILFEEGAVFTDVTYQVTDRLDIQIGGRENIDRIRTFGTEVYSPGPPFADPNLSSKAHAFTYLLTPRFKIQPNLMVYARFASGFRPGGANNPSPDPNDRVPTGYKPDTTVNYELGAKGSAFDQLLSFDASVYYIDWKDIQVGTCTPGCTDFFFENANAAKSQGIELSTELRPLTGLKIGSWVTWNDAELTKPFPPISESFVYGVSGDRLPYSTRFSGNVSVEQSFPIVSSLTGFVGGDVGYVGERLGEFVATPQREVFPAYTKIDLRAGLKNDAWTVNLYVNNLTDKRALLSGGQASGGNTPFAYQIIQPRAVGVTLLRRF